MNIEDIMYQKIREKPGLYLGKPSLSLLFSFMCGYMIRQYEIFGDEQTSNLSKNFLRYIQDYYEISETSKNWCTIICENCSNEEEAFYKYYELWDEFSRQTSD